jgi:hypothetical protein
MTSKQNIDSIFGAAVEITSEEERDLFLQEACGSNVELRDRVERLLRAHAAASGFLPEQGDRTIDIGPCCPKAPSPRRSFAGTPRRPRAGSGPFRRFSGTEVSRHP